MPEEKRDPCTDIERQILHKLAWCSGITPSFSHPMEKAMNSRKKSTLYITRYLVPVIQFFSCDTNPLRDPVKALCKLFLVTWLTRQSKSRNQRGLVTAHNVKLCDKGSVPIPVSNGFQPSLFHNTAVSFQSLQFRQPDQEPGYPPPLEKLPFPSPPHPLLPGIKWSLFSNHFRFCPSALPILFSSRSLKSGFFLSPVSPLVGRGGSGGIFAPFPASRAPEATHA